MELHAILGAIARSLLPSRHAARVQRRRRRRLRRASRWQTCSRRWTPSSQVLGSCAGWHIRQLLCLGSAAPQAGCLHAFYALSCAELDIARALVGRERQQELAHLEAADLQAPRPLFGEETLLAYAYPILVQQGRPQVRRLGPSCVSRPALRQLVHDARRAARAQASRRWSRGCSRSLVPET